MNRAWKIVGMRPDGTLVYWSRYGAWDEEPGFWATYSWMCCRFTEKLDLARAQYEIDSLDTLPIVSIEPTR